MRVLAVDPGLTRCGVAVVETRLDGRTRALVAEVIRTDPDADHADRLGAVFEAITSYLDSCEPDVLVVERVFSQNNVRSAMGTAQAAAVCMLAANQRGLPVHQHTPTEVKAAVTGSGRADKAQVAFMVGRILGLHDVPKPADATDALALGICHVWRSRTGVRA
ncbi:MAG: crossover junction endodeoxyribonuclease RuvC [Actinobacteria bacterium]|nr:crossover junction endodeoxyribonuclease RuvC [Actinomycetota bacterium]MCB9415143.1 crossover junction endodeoxyribonuclease RuvC [Actinomycetota bacterium]MCB9424614.1 crossover junction endodeoxyribonuclease RuvC [Actinomycetota bacterium]HRY08504.1 crossover junction endodeoxyribonuclease RuvC [Candidatus Nanopelagicales bacterium]